MIRTRGLTKTYGQVSAVDGVDLDVREGDVYGFLGANGSGKTTTVRMLLGLVLANAGEAELFGESMPQVRRRRCSPASARSSRARAPTRTCPGAPTWRSSTPAAGPRVRRPARDADQRGARAGRARPGDRRPTKAYSLGMRQRSDWPPR